MPKSLSSPDEEKLQLTLVNLGPSILGGALTTAAATAFLLPCRIVLFVKLGTMLASRPGVDFSRRALRERQMRAGDRELVIVSSMSHSTVPGCEHDLAKGSAETIHEHCGSATGCLELRSLLYTFVFLGPLLMILGPLEDVGSFLWPLDELVLHLKMYLQLAPPVPFQPPLDSES